MFINLIALLAASYSISYAQPIQVNLNEDEFILPPYLMKVEGGKLNILSQGRKYSAEPGEWLDLDQEYDLPDRMAVQVLLHEKAQWVGGGVLKLKAAEHEWKISTSPYKLSLERGLLAVWVDTDRADRAVEIKTTKEKFYAQHAVFWISARAGMTELYLHSGSVSDDDGKVWSEKKYVSYHQGGNGVSTEWNGEAYKIKLSGLYPNLMKTLDQAEEDWQKGRVTETVAKARQKGWRKKLRK